MSYRNARLNVLCRKLLVYRVRGQGFAVGCGWLMNAVVTYAFPVMIEHLGAAWTYAVFGAINVVSLCFYLFIVPETRGTSLEKLEEDFAEKYGD